MSVESPGALTGGLLNAGTPLVDPETGRATRAFWRVITLLHERTGGAQSAIESLRAGVDRAELRKIILGDIDKFAVNSEALSRGAAFESVRAIDTPSAWYITTSASKLADFDVTVDNDDTALRVRCEVDIFNDHNDDVHVGARLEVVNEQVRSFYRLQAFDIEETMIGSLTTASLSAGTYTIRLHLIHYGARSGTPGSTDVKVQRYEIAADKVKATTVTDATGSTQPDGTAGTAPDAPSGGVTP